MARTTVPFDDDHARQRRADAAAIVQALLSGHVGLTHLDELVRTAAVTAWAPVALVSMITDRQVTASAQSSVADAATPVRGDAVPFEDSVCVLALSTDGPIRVSDARHDERVAHIPATVDGVLGSYLGVPLRADGGDTVGVLCVYDAAPRAWTESDEQGLDELAARVAAELVRIRAAYEFELSLGAETRHPR